MKPTKRQAEVLEQMEKGEILRDNQSSYLATESFNWIHPNTFEALKRSGFIKCIGKDKDEYTDIYTITPAGIEAVKEGKK